ncbi:MAG TPA: PD-(D/E)XK nuclease family protein, partial [Cryptosporangiaceae bacterium]|nr:PD-(D/E)XK nuclease family protein [Cryptosporangiaceae bacterium]
SDARPLRGSGDQVRVSPSKVEQFHRCALRWVLEYSGGGTTNSAQAIGNLVHELAAEAGGTVDLATLNARLAARWSTVDVGGGWFARKERERAEQMVAKLAHWLAANRRRLVAVEQAFEVEVGRALVRGRVDRLEADDAGRLVVVDLKTGRTSPPKEGDLAGHPQLGVYQLAVERGGFAEHGTEPGGAALVHVGTTAKKPKEQSQLPLGQAGEPGWAERLVVEAAEGMAGAAFDAVRNDLCRRCPVSTSCPVSSRQVTT